jgi:ferritin-like metal-binding protein YciE
LEQSVQDIRKHADMVKGLLSKTDAEVAKEHCKGMEGLVKEATRQVTAEAPEDQALLDVVIIAQYQRMSHYGLAGFGTAAAYAKALGHKEAFAQLNGIVADIREGDQYASELAIRTEKAAA